MVYFYTIGDERVASSRARVWHVARSLGRDYSVTIVPPRISILRRFRASCLLFFRLSTAGTRDVFYIHKIASPPEILALFLLGCYVGRRVFYDFDDERTGRLARMFMRRARAVVVSSHALQDDALSVQARVFLIPTVVPLEHYQVKDARESGDPIVIGWIGSAKGQMESLKMLVPVFHVLVEKGESFVFRLIGAEGIADVHAMFSGVPGLRFEVIDAIPWDDERSINDAIRQFDIGVMPLSDTSRNRRKAAFKIIQYMASGLPVVASAVGENKFVVEHEQSGLLVAKEREWVEALSFFMHDVAARKRYGARGRQIVEERYALHRMRDMYERIFSL